MAQPPEPTRPGRPPEDNSAVLTTELEPVGEEIVRRRKMDHTLARFSAVHDEITEEEKRKRRNRSRYLPWVSANDELDDALTFHGPAATQAEPEPESAADEDDDEPPGTPLTRLRAKKLRRNERGLLTVKVIAIVVAALLLLGMGVAWGAKEWVNAQLTQTSALDPDAVAEGGAQNFLLVGSDTRAGATAADHVGTSAQVIGARSDTVMLAHISQDHSKVIVTSFPRDLEVTRPACNRWNSTADTYSAQQAPAAPQTKLNDVYAVGGPRCMTKMIQQLSGLKINHFTGIDFSGFKDMVNAVGGVEVCSVEPLRDTVLGLILPHAGKTNVNGDTALNYVRARHVVGDPTSDYGRIKRQQKFLSALLRKLMSNDVLFDIDKLKGFIQAFGKSTFGDNMNIDQLLTLAQSMQGLDSGKITFVTIPTVGTANSRGNEVLKQQDTAALFQAIRDDTPLPGVRPAALATALHTDQVGSTAPQSLASPRPALDAPATVNGIKIQVLNAGNTTDGIARTVATSLGDRGWDVVLTANAGETVPHSVIRYGAARAADATALAAQVPGATLQETDSAGGAVQLLIGQDFTGLGSAHHTSTPKLSTVNASDASCT